MAHERLFDWNWPARPTDQHEFDRMMGSLDRHLADIGLRPNQRGLNAALVVSHQLGLSGTPLIGGRRYDPTPFAPCDLFERIHEWYDDTYGDRNKIDFSAGSVVLILHGSLWELNVPYMRGHIKVIADRDLSNPPPGQQIQKTKTDPPVVVNVLQHVKGLTQSYANRLTAEEMNRIIARFAEADFALNALERLKGSNLFDEARSDYGHSVNALLAGNELAKARWDAAQCAEKIIKGLLARKGYNDYPRGRDGHSHVGLGKVLGEKLQLRLNEVDLDAVYCAPSVRYGEQVSTREAALAAHDALLNILRDIGRHYAPKGTTVYLTSEAYPPEPVA